MFQNNWNDLQQQEGFRMFQDGREKGEYSRPVITLEIKWKP